MSVCQIFMTSIERGTPVLVFMMSFRPSLMGGAELQAFRLAKELAARGIKLFIITRAQKGQACHEWIDGFEVFRIRLYASPFFYGQTRQPNETVVIDYGKGKQENFKPSGGVSILGYLNYFIFCWESYWLIRRNRPKVIYVPTIEWLAVVAVWLGKIFQVKVIVKDSTMNGLTNLLRYPMGRKMHSLLINSAYFVAMTKVIRNQFVNANVPTDRIFSIPNGVSIPNVTRRNVNPDHFLFVGNLSQQPAKGFDILLKAWRQVIKEWPAAQLVVIGSGNITPYLDYVAQSGISKNVHFLGQRQELSAYYNEAMAFILPSRREGMSNALMEAMANEVTCIATDISGNQDLIIHGVNGLLIPPESEDAIVEAIKYVYLHQREAIAMGIEARKTIERGFTFSSVADQYEELLCTVSNQGDN